MRPGSNHSEASLEPILSVIIPAFNEAETLQATIASVCSEQLPFEIILVDGGSTDDTCRIAREAGIRLVTSEQRQRAHQLNLGAQHAQGQTLLFLHADTILPVGALAGIAQALGAPTVVGGAFVRRYAVPSNVLRLTCVLAQWRNRILGWHLGDQAMFVRNTAFFQLGGFREVDCFEDLDFSRRLKRLGQIVTLAPGVVSSARRFQHRGAVLTTMHDLGLTIGYLANGLPEPAALPKRDRVLA